MLPIAVLTVSSVALAQEPANPVQFKLSCNVLAGQSVCSAQIPLPPGKRIVIETISVAASAPPADQLRLYVTTSSANLTNGSVPVNHYLVLTPTTGGVMTYYYANHRVRVYGQSGSTVSIHGQRAFLPGYPGVVNFDVSFSGYLLP
jgi:hypothetical protein